MGECDPQRLQLIADSYLDMLHAMLESPHTEMQIMATDSVSPPPHKHTKYGNRLSLLVLCSSL